jgi:adenylosuccinate lyase
MPHKRNPIGCEQIVGLARIVRANSMVSLENMALWHERDISHSSAERVAIPDSFLALDHMLRRFTGIVKGMRVDAARMRRNLDAGKGLVFSGQLLLELTEKGGLQREEAYRIVQGHAMDAFLKEGDFKALVFADEQIVKTLGRNALEHVFDLTRYLHHTDTLFARVFEAS